MDREESIKRDKECLEYFKKRKKQSERVKEELIKQREILEKKDFNHLLELINDDISDCEDEIKFYTWVLEKENDK